MKVFGNPWRQIRVGDLLNLNNSIEKLLGKIDLSARDEYGMVYCL
jgi:hypothetical protein